jgi:hypothetical protein
MAYRDNRPFNPEDPIIITEEEVYCSEFVKFEILDEFDLTYPKWIQKCYVERMKQILSDPEEFGKAVL